MCGIWFCLGGLSESFGDDAKVWVNALKGRGPESTRICDISGVGVMGFTRLAINGLNPEGMQPMFSDSTLWMCNGEIYNWRALAEEWGIEATSGSDCEVLGPLYEKFCEAGLPLGAFFRALDGVFAIVIVDQLRGRVVVGRDPYGVRPLYMGQRMATRLVGVAPPTWSAVPANLVYGSEIKSLVPFCDVVSPFQPGHYQVLDIGTKKSLEMAPYHTVQALRNPAYSPGAPAGLEMACLAVRQALTAAVRKRLMTERPVAALLSGGVDSSLIAALVAQELRAAGVTTPLRTFSIGMLGSTDLYYARKVAEHIGSEHTEVVLDADDFFGAVGSVIRDIETYDTTTVRASVGNWLVAKAIAEESDCKVVFNGDGSDELWGSYLYFYNAPTDTEFEEEVTRLLTDIHYFDVLRSDRSISSHGLEPRTPFLDKQFVAVARSAAAAWRRPVRGVQPEKWLMRRAFDGCGLLPREVLWRQKEAFSDGVSGQEKSWYQIAQEKALKLVGADWEAAAARSYGVGPTSPRTAEQYYYRKTFDSYFGKQYAAVNVPYFWMPRWCEGATDPSARTLAVYEEAAS